MQPSDMSKDERSLLLYLETCAVDHAGLVDIRHMNSDDIELANKWSDSGFIKFGRVAFHDINKGYSHWCQLSVDAWSLVNAERFARAARTFSKRTWRTTDEKRESQV